MLSDELKLTVYRPMTFLNYSGDELYLHYLSCREYYANVLVYFDVILR